MSSQPITIEMLAEIRSSLMRSAPTGLSRRDRPKRKTTPRTLNAIEATNAKRRAAMQAKPPRKGGLSNEQVEAVWAKHVDPDYYSRDTTGLMRSTLSGGTYSTFNGRTRAKDQQ